MKFAALLAAALLTLAAVARADDTPNTLTVNGTGVVNAIPDEGYVTVSVATVEPTAGEALTANTTTANKLYAALNELGVERKNIKTVVFSVEDHFKQVNRRPDDAQPVFEQVKDGFQVTNTVRITVCELAQFGKVLDSVVTEGATNITGISFGSSKAESYLHKARSEAAKDAVIHAAVIAQGLGVNLGRPLQVVEIENGRTHARYDSLNASGRGAPEAAVSGGSLSFTVTVNVKFGLN